MPAMLPRRLLPWLFALSLLFAQAAAFAHALTHLHASDAGLPEQSCEICVAQAQLGAALPSTPPALWVPPAAHFLVVAAAPCCVDLAPRPACARAPPLSVNA
jgi:hypothetical protein